MVELARNTRQARNLGGNLVNEQPRVLGIGGLHERLSPRLLTIEHRNEISTEHLLISPQAPSSSGAHPKPAGAVECRLAHRVRNLVPETGRRDDDELDAWNELHD